MDAEKVGNAVSKLQAIYRGNEARLDVFWLRHERNTSESLQWRLDRRLSIVELRKSLKEEGQRSHTAATLLQKIHRGKQVRAENSRKPVPPDRSRRTKRHRVKHRRLHRVSRRKGEVTKVQSAVFSGAQILNNSPYYRPGKAIVRTCAQLKESRRCRKVSDLRARVSGTNSLPHISNTKTIRRQSMPLATNVDWMPMAKLIGCGTEHTQCHRKLLANNTKNGTQLGNLRMYNSTRYKSAFIAAPHNVLGRWVY